MAVSMSSAEKLITTTKEGESVDHAGAIIDHIDVWTSAIKKRGSQGRGSNKKIELYGIKKLRELILELAVRGLLVPQDPNDEPASVLLEKIAAEKERLIKDGKIKKSKTLVPASDNGGLFELPLGWMWSRVGLMGIGATGKTPKTSMSECFNGNIQFIGPGQITPSGKLLDSDKTLTDIGLGFSSEANTNDILMVCIGGSIGKAAIADKRISFNQQINALQPLIVSSGYLYLAMTTNFFFRSVLASSTGSATPIINRMKWEELLVPIAPEAEQPRIVAKVNELMALCDQLEQQTESSLTAHQTLVETLLNTLLTAAQTSSSSKSASSANLKAADTKESDSPASSHQINSFDAAWNRIAEHFNLLFTTEHSIDQLKQTILQLAVMGKLVPQDPNDEPASVLLEKIAAEKEQLIKDKKIKKQKPLSPISDEEKPFELPSGWEWCRLDDLALHSEAGWSPKCNGYSREHEKWGVLKVSAVSWGEYRPEENKELPDNLEPREQYEVVEGDFLISRANTAELVARAVVVPVNSPNKLMMSDKIIRFSFSELIESEYVNLVNASQVSRDYYAAVAGGTSSSMKNVTRGHIRNLVIALPPKHEARRIFSQYKSLLSVCDTLKAHVSESQVIQLHLADAMAENALV